MVSPPSSTSDKYNKKEATCIKVYQRGLELKLCLCNDPNQIKNLFMKVGSNHRYGIFQLTIGDHWGSQVLCLT